jgi:excisionase family DNA binding protein
MPLPELYTVEDLAKIFKVTPRTIRDWIDAGVFPTAKKVGAGWYIKKEDIDAMFESDAEDGESPPKPKPGGTKVLRSRYVG